MKNHPPRFLTIVNENRTKVTETTVSVVWDRLSNGEKLTLIDVREDREWEAGRIPGAIHLSKGVIERDIEARFPDTNEELILYCGGGFRSVLSAVNLQEMGYTNVISMDGGYRGWQEAGLPLDSTPVHRGE